MRSLALLASGSAIVEAENRVGVLASYLGEGGAYGQAYRTSIEMAEVSHKASFVYEEDSFLPAKSDAMRLLSTPLGEGGEAEHRLRVRGRASPRRYYSLHSLSRIAPTE